MAETSRKKRDDKVIRIKRSWKPNFKCWFTTGARERAVTQGRDVTQLKKIKLTMERFADLLEE